jgi:hypothetical protein
LQSNPHIRNRQRVLDELAAGKIVLASPIDLSDFWTIVLDQELGPTVAEGVDNRGGAATLAVVVELRTRPIQIAGVKEGSQAIANFLVWCLGQIRKMRRSQEAVLGDKSDECDVAVG